jgi:hypothetical protein
MMVGVLASACAISTPQSQLGKDTPTSSLVFDGVTVVDVEHGTLLPAYRVVVVGNRIATMGGTGTVQIPAGARVIDARGKYLMPGLWDMHTHSYHYADLSYPLFLANGVTGIRDANSDVPLDTLVQWRKEIIAGTRIGPPRQILVGPALFDADHPVCHPAELRSVLCFHVADAPRIVDSLKAAGADMLKMYGLGRKIYFAVLDEARRQGIPVGGHLDFAVPGGLVVSMTGDNAPGALEASDSGVRIIDHVNSSAELSAICIGTFGNVTDSVRCRQLAEHFRRNNTWWVPTLNIRGQGGTYTARSDSIFTRADADVVKFWSTHVLPAGGQVELPTEQNPQFPSTGSGLLSLAQRVGLPILAGTDVSGTNLHSSIPGFSLHRELQLMVAEGLTPLHALQAATLNPATMLHGTDSLGTIVPGKLADLVLLDANPLENIDNTMAIRAVVANGRYYPRATLDTLLAQAKVRDTLWTLHLHP